MVWPFRNKAAIDGLGYTEFSKNSGVSTLTLGLRAVLAAVEDAGIAVDAIDGLATHRTGDSAVPATLAHSLGLTDLAWQLDLFGGGSASHSVVGQAALAVCTGIADYVVCYRALNARSEFRMGGSGRPPVDVAESQYQAPYGYFTPPQQFAMVAREHMLRWGTTHEQLGSIAVQQRAHALDNPRAQLRHPITLDDYLASRWVVEPFRLFDCCLESDGAVALVITTAERARDLRHTPVWISAAAWGGGRTLYSAGEPDATQSAARHVSRRLYAMAGVGPSEFDFAELYDCFTWSVLVQLEDYGFCAKGEGGPFAASGAIARGGAIPVNTHGGFLCEGYVHGLNHVTEAVQQLRHEAGARQVPGAELALSSAQPGYVSGVSSALILQRGA
jgi:acetyl-CoA acetyltransferase